jgi:SAM-dependent methyltransferase
MEPAEYQRMHRLETNHWWFVSRRHLAETILKQRLTPHPQRRILDVGCGTGGNLAWLSQWGRVYGLDLSALPLSFARSHGNRLALASVLLLPFSAQTFGLITAFDVLYHQWVTGDSQALAGFYRVLTPGGWLLITDSALPWLWSPHDRLYHSRQRYTRAELERKVRAAGFEPRLCTYSNSLLLPAIMAVRLLMRWLPLQQDVDMHALPRPLNNLLINIRRLETGWIRRGGCWPAGSSLVCLAQKPAPGQ